MKTVVSNALTKAKSTTPQDWATCSKKNRQTESETSTTEEVPPNHNLEEAANDYHEIAANFANLLAQTVDFRNRCDHLRKIMNDNGDPVFDLDEAIRSMGIALASLVTYADEYGKEVAIRKQSR